MADQVNDSDRMDELRQEIAQVDRDLVEILARRLEVAREIGAIKKRLDLPVMDPGREAEVVRRAAALARDRGVDPELVRDVLWRTMAQARGVQDRPPPRR